MREVAVTPRYINPITRLGIVIGPERNSPHDLPPFRGHLPIWDCSAAKEVHDAAEVHPPVHTPTGRRLSERSSPGASLRGWVAIWASPGKRRATGRPRQGHSQGRPGERGTQREGTVPSQGAPQRPGVRGAKKAAVSLLGTREQRGRSAARPGSWSRRRSRASEHGWRR
jgi:hypothetical protein